MDKPRHPQVFRSWKVERLKQRQQPAGTAPRKGARPQRKKNNQTPTARPSDVAS